MAKKRRKKVAKSASRKSPIELVQEAMPGMEVIPAGQLSPNPAADAASRTLPPGASLQRLKEDLGGAAPESAAGTQAQADSRSDDDQIEVFQVRPKKHSTDAGSGPGSKTVIVHKKKGIIGIQG